MLTVPSEIIKYFNILKKSIEELKTKYGDEYEEHIDEIYSLSIAEKENQRDKLDSNESIDEIYDKLKTGFEQYKDSLTEENKRKLDLAIEIYSSSLFVSLNRIASVKDYKSKSGAELITECDKNEDFKYSFHERFRYFNSILNSTNDGSVAVEFSDKSGFLGKYRYINYILVKKGTPYIIPINDQAYTQREVIFLGSAVDLEKIGYNCSDAEVGVNARTYIMSPKERVIEKDDDER